MNIKKIALILALVPMAAFAGKAERDYVSGTAEPAVKEAAAALKKSCGCDVKIDIVKVDAYKDTDELRQITNVSKAIAQGAAAHCTDAASKAAICKMKSLEISRGTSTDFKFSGGKGVATSDSSSSASWDMIVAQLDK